MADPASEEVVPWVYGEGFQKSVIALALRDPAFCYAATRHLRALHFVGEDFVQLFAIIETVVRNGQGMPTRMVVENEILRLPPDRQVVLNALLQDILETEGTNTPYVEATLKEFVQKNILKRGLSRAVEAYNTDTAASQIVGVIQKVQREVSEVSFQPPDRSLYFDTFQEREVRRMLDRNSDRQTRFETGLGSLDELLGGGLSRKELGVVIAYVNVGKSIFLLNLALAVTRSRTGKALLILLEGSRQDTEDRLDARFSQVALRELWAQGMPETVAMRTGREFKYLEGSLVVRGFLDSFSYTTDDVEAEIQALAFQGFRPDVLLVDYADLLEPRTSSLVDNTYLGQAQIYKDLRILASKYDMAVWTAAQVKRTTDKRLEDPNHVFHMGDTGDSISKARLVDILMSLNQSPSERTRGVMRLHVDKVRNANKGQTVDLIAELDRMTIREDERMMSVVGKPSPFMWRNPSDEDSAGP